MTSAGTRPIGSPFGAGAGMRERLRRFVEALLPWYSPQQEAVRARRKHERIARAEAATERIRAAYRADDERLAHR